MDLNTNPEVRNGELQLQGEVLQLEVRNLRDEGGQVADDQVLDGDVSPNQILTT